MWLERRPGMEAKVYQTRSLHRGDPRMAAALQTQVRELATDALGRVAPANRTVAAELLVARFVDRFAASIDVADWTILLRWVDSACRRYAGVLAVAPLLIAVAGAVRELLAGSAAAGADARELDAVCTEIERLTSIPRLVREPAAARSDRRDRRRAGRARRAAGRQRPAHRRAFAGGVVLVRAPRQASRARRSRTSCTSRAAASCTTSAKSPRRRRSSTRRGASPTRRWTSCGATPRTAR